MKSRSLQSCPKTTFQPRMIQHSERNYDPYVVFVTAGRQICATHEPPLLWSSPGLYCHLWNPTNERRARWCHHGTAGIHKTNDGRWAKKTAQKRQRTTIWRLSDGLWRVKLDLSARLYRSARENQALAHFKNSTPVVSKVSGLHPNPAGIKCFCSRSN